MIPQPQPVLAAVSTVSVQGGAVYIPMRGEPPVRGVLTGQHLRMVRADGASETWSIGSGAASEAVARGSLLAVEVSESGRPARARHIAVEHNRSVHAHKGGFHG